MKKYMDILNNCSLFEGMTQRETEDALNCLGARVVKTGENQGVLVEGDPAVYMGIVLSGNIRIVRDELNGSRSIMAEAGPGELFAEAVAVSSAENMPVSAVASEDGEVMLLDCRKVLSTCEKSCTFHSRLISNLLRIVADKNLILNQKIEIISKRTIRERLMTYLMIQSKRNNSYEFEIPFNRQELADYLGVDRSAMSAEIGRMGKDGLIESRRNRFRLLWVFCEENRHFLT